MMVSKYIKYKSINNNIKMPEMSELENFDWNNKKPKSKPIVRSVKNPLPKQNILDKLHSLCSVCNICDIGENLVTNDGILRDPHLPNSLIKSKIVILYNNPSIEHIKERDMILERGSYIENKPYTTYLIKCYTEDYSEKYYENCLNYLNIELRVIKPKLILAMDQISFDFLKADKSLNYIDNHKVINSSIYGYKMMAIVEHHNINIFVNNLAKAINC